ncbi:YggT family protein [Litorivivens lipolytica]|uniref:YggT family protein n=1 Tax=Litorivivens lipolytica TaxID=1524264 RepID=A0A7W4Z8A5_9GAMM|nr:YggT family protein [Litorivivens lipolytica]MBB3048766.1 YggT family protein [Litorivivens lipolytica]
MGPMTEIGFLLVQTLFSLYLGVVILRLLLQLARADFYNPISQFMVKATNPLLLPLRKVVPPLGKIDSASIVLALAVQMIAMLAILLLFGARVPDVLTLLGWSVIGCIALTVNIYFFAIIINIILSWVAPGSYHPAAVLLYQLTEPVMQPFRKLIPPMGGIDLSPILVFLSISVLQILIKAMAQSAGLSPALVFGL